MKTLGIDEAGKGPVIGSMIIAGVMTDKPLQIEGIKDSKLLSHKTRLDLDKKIKKTSKWKIIEVSPKEIDKAVFSKNLNLNWLEAIKQAEIINELKPDKAIIDCPSPNIRKYTDYLKNLLDNKQIKLVVEHKADLNYQICGAASILAKVRREEEMDKIKKKYGNTGPGYTSNEITQKFIKENWNKHPEIFRHSWSTFKNCEKQKNQKKLGEF